MVALKVPPKWITATFDEWVTATFDHFIHRGWQPDSGGIMWKSLRRVLSDICLDLTIIGNIVSLCWRFLVIHEYEGRAIFVNCFSVILINRRINDAHNSGLMNQFAAFFTGWQSDIKCGSPAWLRRTCHFQNFLNGGRVKNSAETTYDFQSRLLL